VALLTFFITS